MEITFGPKNKVMMDDVRIIYRNFSGRPSQYNREGDRNFNIVIDDEEIANRLVEEGWNVKIKAPREEGMPPFMTLAVKVKFNDFGPKVYLVTNGRMTELDEDTVFVLDNIDIQRVDLDIHPYDWCVQGKEGRTAYLEKIAVVQEADRFTERYCSDPSPMPSECILDDLEM